MLHKQKHYCRDEGVCWTRCMEVHTRSSPPHGHLSHLIGQPILVSSVEAYRKNIDALPAGESEARSCQPWRPAQMVARIRLGWLILIRLFQFLGNAQSLEFKRVDGSSTCVSVMGRARSPARHCSLYPPRSPQLTANALRPPTVKAFIFSASHRKQPNENGDAARHSQTGLDC